MSWKKIGLSLLLADFGGYTAYALYQHGYLGLIQAATANAAVTQVSLDLAIALGFVVIWMWRDARQHGISPVPFVLVTLVLGSIGPLLYVIRRPEKEAAGATVVATRSGLAMGGVGAR